MPQRDRPAIRGAGSNVAEHGIARLIDTRGIFQVMHLAVLCVPLCLRSSLRSCLYLCVLLLLIPSAFDINIFLLTR